ncbi:MAG: hypothetical protein V9G08_08015 [Dermatophilaceae bacterium]
MRGANVVVGRREVVLGAAADRRGLAAVTVTTLLSTDSPPVPATT